MSWLEFEPTAESIRNWVKQAKIDEGQRSDGLSTDEKQELARLRRENKQLRLEREILAKATAWFARRPARFHPSLRVRESAPGAVSDYHDVPCTGSLHQWLLCVVEAAAVPTVAQDSVLTGKIKRIHDRSKGTYGAPRIHAQLAREGIHVGRKRVARLMRG